MVESNTPERESRADVEGNAEGNSPTADQLMKQIRQFRLAESDMEQAAAAATSLQRVHWSGLRRALETAVAVCYARPFTEGTDLDRKKWAPRERSANELHWSLIELRNTLYAHTEPDTGRREIIDLGRIFIDDIEISSRIYGEQYYSIPAEILLAIVALAEERQATFRAKADDLEHKLGRPRRDPSDSGWNVDPR